MRANLLAALIGMLCVVGCGGGGSSINGGGSGGGGNSGSNVQSVSVDAGPTAIANSNSPAVNTLYTQVTVCVPGTSNCQTIDHIQVDTGSSGLRIISTELSLNLTVQTQNGSALAECVRFVDGSSWGSVRLADIKIAGELASNQPIQIIGDPAYTIPSACSGTGTVEDTVAEFGAKGILGVGPFISDCGSACTAVGNRTYYTCASSNNCLETTLAVAAQVSNPVAAFTTDNNGVIITLPTVSNTGQQSASGSLTFGIGTQSNNGLGNARVMTVDSNQGAFETDFNSKQLKQSFIDSGSNALYFPDDAIPVCGANGQSSIAPGFFCPSGTLNLSATLVSSTGSTISTINFSVANAETLFSTSSPISAVATLAGSSVTVSSGNTGDAFDGSNTFDWGLPFYFGRTVITAIETRNTSGGMGPYFAF